MAAIVLALGASLSWGFADFFGPLKGRTLGVLRVLLWAELAGLLVIAAAVAVRWRGPHDATVLLAIPAALSGTLGLFAYYRGMAVGAMSVVAPIAGVSAAVPVAVGLALLAAIGFGGYFVPMHAAGAADFWWASLIFRATALLLVVAAVAITRPSVRVTLPDLAFVSAVGFGDLLGNVLFAASAGHGLLSVTSVLASLYPIVTVALARVVLRERVDRGQQAGVVATLAGVAMISAG